MKIGVVSDTHDNVPMISARVSRELMEVFHLE
jgi:predicted phosphodiesterase